MPRRVSPARDRGPAEPGSQLVVIGSSAGGIEALAKVVAGLPDDFPAPIVIAQHLDPRRPSHLGEILRRHTSLELRVVDEDAALEDGVIFVVPSNHHVEVTDHHIRLGAREANESTPSVDRLLLSAAAIYGPSLIAVILTGSGSDGTAGARAVNAAGGTVVIENPKTAAFPSMPESLPATIVDVVADLDAIGELLGKLVTTGVVVESVDEDSLEALLSRLRQRSGIAFSKYKRPTILRRLQTRMAATNQPSLTTYGRLVAQDQAEYDRLISSLLIKVTEFFRDTKVWTYLADQVLPGLVGDARRDGRELRLWSAGCSTGEEAYSLALLVAAAVEDKRMPDGIRIFATDVDADAIAFARRGHYPESALDGVPARLRKRYLTDSTGDREIAKHVRDMVVFGEHDLGERAPFPRIDLVLCRNVLIYFTPAMQRAALETFAFSLRADGALVLGSSETTAALPEPFTEEETRLRVYRRSPASARPSLIVRPTPGRPAPRHREEASLGRAIETTRRDVGRRPERSEAVEKVLLELSVGVVVIDRRYDIERINGAARRLLGIHGIAFDQDFIHLAESMASTALREAIDAALAGKTTTSLFEADMTEGGTEETRKLRVTTTPYRPTAERIEGVVIELLDVTDEVREQRARARLDRQNERLVRANEELTRTIVDLRSSNEVMLFSSEDAQSAREEVQTLNEEMQATNEELETLNEELTASVEELTAANEDLAKHSEALASEHRGSEERRSRLEAILSSQGDAVLAVDREGKPVLTNGAYERMFGSADATFEPKDAAGLPLPHDAWPQVRAAAGERFRMRFTLSGPDGSRRWFEAVAEPLTAEDSEWVGVLTIRDETEQTVRTLLEEVLAAASHELRTPVAALNGYVQLVTRQLDRGNIEQAVEYATRATVQAGRLGDLVEQLFDVSRIRSGRLELSRKRTDLVTLVGRAVEVAQGLPGAPTIALEAKSAKISIRVDPGRIEQILVILLANAIEHGPAGKGIEVKVSLLSDAVDVGVCDTGPGIAPADVARLFQPFARLGATERRGAAGLGLGLYIARQIAQAHGGEIVVDSAPGKGSTFHLRLPLKLAAGRASRSRSPQVGK